MRASHDDLAHAIHSRYDLSLEDLVQVATAELPEFLERQRWFGGKARRVRSVSPIATVPLAVEAVATVMCVVVVRYESGGPEHYAVPLALVRPEQLEVSVDDALASVETNSGELLLCDGLQLPGSRAALLDAVRSGRCYAGPGGSVCGFVTAAGGRLSEIDASNSYAPSLEQSNSAILYEDSVFLKLFRRIAPGPNPDLEIGRFLTDVARFPHVPAVYGGLELRCAEDGEPWSLALAQEAIRDLEADAWQKLCALLRRAAAERAAEVDEAMRLIGDVARCTARLHRALASETDDPAFCPEPATSEFIAGLVERVTAEARAALDLLRASLHELHGDDAALARTVLDRWPRLVGALQRAGERSTVQAKRIRVHGDYHLGQVLLDRRGRLYIIDFEGEPARPLVERRRKELVLKDVAGLLRSIDYAASAVAFERPAARAGLETWAERAANLFWDRYVAELGDVGLLPRSTEQARILRDVYLIEKACYELTYELNNRPDWVRIPLAGLNRITEMLGSS